MVNQDAPQHDDNQPDPNEHSDHTDKHDDSTQADDSLFELLSSEDMPPESPPRPRFSRFRRQSRPRSESRPAPRPPATTVVTIQNAADRSMTFRVSGSRLFHGPRVEGWQVDFGTLNVQMNDLGRFIAMYHQQDDDAGRESWRYTAREIGGHLYQGLLNADPMLARELMRARRFTRPMDTLTLAFAGPRDYLSVPYELLHDRFGPLALRYPICRQMTGVPAHTRESFWALIARLREAGEALRVLLVSSGAWLVAADEEIASLETDLRASADRANLPLEIDVVYTGSMGLDGIRAALRQPYHIIHYTGQVYHDRANDQNSGLLFGAAHEPRTGQILIPVRELVDLLPAGATRLFTISACLGPQEWDGITLSAGDHLGVMGAFVEAGIPAVLGFRWHVTNQGRQQFVQQFYERLLADPFVPEYAVLHARQVAHQRDGQDETWASPLFVTQHLYEGES
ncbi:MAG: CHAT domain-containing protein [Anaerolineae bacterium]|nr:CHAT domain-containing protein [Anaerolineae bacterium]